MEMKMGMLMGSVCPNSERILFSHSLRHSFSSKWFLSLQGSRVVAGVDVDVDVDEDCAIFPRYNPDIERVHLF